MGFARIRSLLGGRALCVAVGLAAGGSALAQSEPTGAPPVPRTGFIEPYVRLQETYSTNSTLTESGGKRGDWTTELGTGVRLRYTSRHASLNGLVGLQAYHAIENTANRRVNPNVNVTGHLEAIERFFFIDGSITANRTWASPFAPQPQDGTSVLGNRYTQTTYRIAPSIQGTVAGTPYSYSLRDEIAKINSGATSGTLGDTTSASDATTNALIGKFTRAPTPIGWELAYSDSTTRFASGESSITQEIGRGRLIWQVDPILQFFAIGGYEHTQSAQVARGGPVYGAGGNWRPTPRTSLNATWEHRFFGPAHTIAFDHRWPGFAISASSSRDITTFPQLVAQFPGAGNVEALLNAQYLTRIPDAQARQQAVETLIRAYNLPTVVGGPLNFVSQDLLLRNAQNLTFTLIGTRNALAAGLFYTRTEPLNAAASTVPSVFGLLSANSQRGFTLTFSQRLTPILDANLVLSRIRSESLNTLIGGSSEDALRLTVTQKLSAKTSGFVGARYQRFHSNISALGDYSETGAFVGIDHRF